MTNKQAILQLQNLREHCNSFRAVEGIWEADMEAIDLAIKALDESNNKRWRAEKGGDYWCVNCYCRAVTKTIEYNLPGDDYLYHSHNYFRTREEAEKYARVLETEMLLRKFADDNNPTTIDWNDTDEQKKFHLVYSRTINKLLYLSTYDGCEARAVYFTSSEVVQQAIEAIGKDRLMEYLAYEW